MNYFINYIVENYLRTYFILLSKLIGNLKTVLIKSSAYLYISIIKLFIFRRIIKTFDNKIFDFRLSNKLIVKERYNTTYKYNVIYCY